MRTLIFAACLVTVAGAATAQEQPDTVIVAEVLACEGDASPGVCLLRAGARGWDGDAVHSRDVLRAAFLLGLDDGPDALPFGEDKMGQFAVARAIAEARRLDASGAAPETALAPIAA